jgi:biofilm PGA synthesis N-glycosyltransferase PgaC
MKIIFFFSLFLIFYTFIGYGVILYLLIKLKRFIVGKKTDAKTNVIDLPTCTVIIAAYNEEAVIEEKIVNTLDLYYPKNLVKYIFVTDGSTDLTPSIVAKHSEILLLHQTSRNGKINAVHRAIIKAETEVIVFTDANALLNKNALYNICRHYNNPLVGAVSGEKRVHIDDQADATAGEGFYWKYESKLKKWDSELYSVVGAAGELFSIRRSLYQPIPANSVLDDFMISMLIAKKGYRIIYEPTAYAIETASANISEELKRKIRISAGGIQSILYLKSLFNIFRLPILSFQYISHRVLRWTITPFLLIAVFILNGYLAMNDPLFFFKALFLSQIAFYLMALVGWIMETKHVHIKWLFVPYYFCMMNYAVIAGLIRFFYSGQDVVWKKAERKLSHASLTKESV